MPDSEQINDMSVSGEPCRSCWGKRGTHEPTGRGASMFWPCMSCGGTGKQTVRVFPGVIS